MGSLIAVAVALAVVLGGAFVVYRQVENACSGQVPLTVAAAAEIAPAVAAEAEQLNGGKIDIAGSCVEITVTAVEAADMAATIAGQLGISLDGVGQADGNTVAPDVWIPDSSTWLIRMNAPGTFDVSDATSIAHSPVVLAMPEPVASTLGWPKTQLTWEDLVKQVTTDSRLHVGIVEPTRDAASLSGLLALGKAAAAAPNAQAASTAAMRSLASGRSALRQDLLARFPRSTDPTAIASGLSVAALSEQAVIAYNEKKPPIPLAALYINPPPLALDYPFAILPGADADRTRAAQALLERLRAPAFRDQLGAHGLRAGDGTVSDTFTAPQGAPDNSITSSAAPSGTETQPDPAVVDRALSTWTAITKPGRLLAVVDVSGSMLYRVPTAKNATRATVTKEAARRGLALFDDSWAVGLWVFSTQLVGDKDYRQLVPIGPLTSQRDTIDKALAGIEPKPTGDTGLYDTVLAGYKTVQTGWDPGRVNSLVIFSDGDNDDPAGGLSHKQLLDQLKKIIDPKKPIQVIIIGIGDVDDVPLKEVTNVTGGGVFVTKDPAKIGEIFLKAISLRSATN